MAEDVPYEAERVFGPGKKTDFGETGREPAKGSGPTSQKRTEWKRLVSPSPPPGAGTGNQVIYGDSTEP
jgi:hypothetical protein